MLLCLVQQISAVLAIRRTSYRTRCKLLDFCREELSYADLSRVLFQATHQMPDPIAAKEL